VTQSGYQPQFSKEIMNINQLKSLDALAHHGSYSKAAQALGITQPAVSIQLRKLQERYGVKLFWRWGREVEFSELGQEVVLKARKVLGLLSDLDNSLCAASQLKTGRLEIGLSCHYFVMDMLAVFMTRYPAVNVRAQIGDSQTLIDAVLSCQLDLAEITGTEPVAGLSNITYSDQHIVLFVSHNHRWADLQHIHVDQLAGEPMVARHQSSMTRTIFQTQLKTLNIAPRIILELDAWETMKEAVAAGIGFGIALEDEFTQDNRLVGIRVDGVDLAAKQYFVCLPEFEQMRTVRAFMQLVNEFKASRQQQNTGAAN
jgi:DNA-binding transcriptional LysR family regulator